jgi:Immunity protein 63
MSRVSLSTIRRRVKALGAKIGATSDQTRVASQSDEFGTPHIEIDGSQYHYIVSERGEIHKHKTTQSLDELLYWILDDATFDMATKYELTHRIPGQDSRRLWFQKQIELLQAIDPVWGERKRQEFERVLERHPFVDGREDG